MRSRCIINTLHLIFIFSLFVTAVIDSFELCKSIFYLIWGHVLAQAHMARGKLNLAQPSVQKLRRCGLFCVKLTVPFRRYVMRLIDVLWVLLFEPKLMWLTELSYSPIAFLQAHYILKSPWFMKYHLSGRCVFMKHFVCAYVHMYECLTSFL